MKLTRPTANDVLELVCDMCNTTAERVRSDERGGHTLLARRAITVLLHRRLGMSFPEIGEFQHKCHSAVMYQYKFGSRGDVREIVDKAAIRLGFEDEVPLSTRMSALESRVATLEQMVAGLVRMNSGEAAKETT